MSQINILENLDHIKEIISKYETIIKKRNEACNKYYHGTKGKDYYKSYYLKNKDKYLKIDRDAKKLKYQTDPEYRAMILERSKTYRINKKLKKEINNEVIE